MPILKKTDTAPLKAVPQWDEIMDAENARPYMRALQDFLQSEDQSGAVIYPPAPQRFAALEQTPLENVRVVILGQDPYHGAGQAHGLSFSVPAGVRPPPSLKNIFKELERSLGIPPRSHGDLTGWAGQGVLLLNTTLTVRDGEAAAHAGRGWEHFTDAVIAAVNEHRDNVVFMLWGGHAQKKAAMLDRERHLVLTAPHPSPLSAHRGFIGCDHFRQANDYLKNHGYSPIDWS